MNIFKAFIDHIKRYVAMDKKDCCCTICDEPKEAYYDVNGDCMVVAPKKKVKKVVKNLRKSKGRKK